MATKLAPGSYRLCSAVQLFGQLTSAARYRFVKGGSGVMKRIQTVDAALFLEVV